MRLTICGWRKGLIGGINPFNYYGGKKRPEVVEARSCHQLCRGGASLRLSSTLGRHPHLKNQAPPWGCVKTRRKKSFRDLLSSSGEDWRDYDPRGKRGNASEPFRDADHSSTALHFGVLGWGLDGWGGGGVCGGWGGGVGGGCWVVLGSIKVKLDGFQSPDGPSGIFVR